MTTYESCWEGVIFGSIDYYRQTAEFARNRILASMISGYNRFCFKPVTEAKVG